MGFHRLLASQFLIKNCRRVSYKLVSYKTLRWSFLYALASYKTLCTCFSQMYFIIFDSKYFRKARIPKPVQKPPTHPTEKARKATKKQVQLGVKTTHLTTLCLAFHGKTSQKKTTWRFPLSKTVLQVTNELYNSFYQANILRKTNKFLER